MQPPAHKKIFEGTPQNAQLHTLVHTSWHHALMHMGKHASHCHRCDTAHSQRKPFWEKSPCWRKCRVTLKIDSTTLKQGRKAPLIFTTSPCTNYAAATWPPTCLPVGHWGHTCEPLGTMHPSFQRQRTTSRMIPCQLGETSCPPNSRTHFTGNGPAEPNYLARLSTTLALWTLCSANRFPINAFAKA